MRQKRKLSSDQLIREVTPPAYKTKFLEKAIEEERKAKILRRIKDQEAKNKRDKANRFSKIVQEIYWSNERKQAECKLREEMAIRKFNIQLKGEQEERPQVQNYLPLVIQQNSEKKLRRRLRNDKNQKQTKTHSLNTTTAEQAKPPLKDYLKEMRLKRFEQSKRGINAENSKVKFLNTLISCRSIIDTNKRFT